ncbi:MAG TPA: GAF domain-containing protein, partial [Gallionellaceae bacterium]|nr:GAF domain-containing protein [Gallionellaceae bacterium]
MSFEKMTKMSWIYDLYRLGQNALQEGKTADIYQRILEHIVAGFEAKSGSLALHDRASDKLTIVAGIDLPANVIGSKVNMGEGVLGWVVKEGKALLINGDISNDARFQLRARAGRTAASANSAICWPLKIEDHIIGGISVNRPEGMPIFSDSELEQGTALLNMVSLALGNIQLHLEQHRQLDALQLANQKLEEAHNQLLQSEKMASIGQLAAGVAHEINNPIGFVYSNLGALERYVQDLFAMLTSYEEAEGVIADAEMKARLQAARQKLDIAFLKEDLGALMAESKDGITRVK